MSAELGDEPQREDAEGQSVSRRLRTMLGSANAPILAAILGVLLSLPTVVQGLLLDDHLMRAAASTDGVLGFVLLDEPAEQLRERGALGWWAADDLRLRFMRPLAALTHALDFQLWPRALWLMHLENVLLYGLLIFVVGRVLQQLLGRGPVAGLACLVFAVDELHATTVMWISARSTILAALFGMLAFAAHLRWRTRDAGDRRWPYALAGPLCFALALMSAEIGLAGLGYIAAYSLTRERGGVGARVSPLLPYLAITLAWRVAYVQLGFGAVGSGLYVEPGDDPLGLLLALGLQTPALAFAALSLPVADALGTTSDPTWLVPAALAFVALAWVLAPLRDDRNARVLGVALLAATLPLALTAPTSRTMLILGPASAGLFAMAWDRRESLALSGRLRRIGLRFMAACQLVLAPLLFVPLSFAPLLAESGHREIAATVPETERVVVLINAPMEINALYPEAMRELAGRPWPAHCYLLFAGLTEVTVERVDTHTLALSSDVGWATSRVDRLSRAWARRGFAPGDRIELERAEVEVVEVTGDGRPLRVRVRFDDHLDELVLLGFDGDDLSRWTPAVGERAVWTASLAAQSN